jgi:hypothetical protein
VGRSQLDQQKQQTLPNFIERTGEKRKQGPRIKVQASKQPNKGGWQGGKGTTKIITLHLLHEANKLKRTPSLEEPSLAVTAGLEMEADCVLYKTTDALFL